MHRTVPQPPAGRVGTSHTARGSRGGSRRGPRAGQSSDVAALAPLVKANPTIGAALSAVASAREPGVPSRPGTHHTQRATSTSESTRRPTPTGRESAHGAVTVHGLPPTTKDAANSQLPSLVATRNRKTVVMEQLRGIIGTILDDPTTYGPAPALLHDALNSVVAQRANEDGVACGNYFDALAGDTRATLELRSTKHEVDMLRRQLTLTDQAVDDVGVEKRGLQLEIEAGQKALRESEISESMARARVAEVEGRLGSKDKDLAAERFRITKLQAQLQHLNQEEDRRFVSRTQDLRHQLETTRDMLRQSDETIRGMERELSSLKQSLEDLERQHNETTRELDASQDLVARRETSVEALQGKVRSRNELLLRLQQSHDVKTLALAHSSFGRRTLAVDERWGRVLTSAAAATATTRVMCGVPISLTVFKGNSFPLRDIPQQPAHIRGKGSVKLKPLTPAALSAACFVVMHALASPARSYGGRTTAELAREAFAGLFKDNTKKGTQLAAQIAGYSQQLRSAIAASPLLAARCEVANPGDSAPSPETAKSKRRSKSNATPAQAAPLLTASSILSTVGGVETAGAQVGCASFALLLDAMLYDGVLAPQGFVQRLLFDVMDRFLAACVAAELEAQNKKRDPDPFGAQVQAYVQDDEHMDTMRPPTPTRNADKDSDAPSVVGTATGPSSPLADEAIDESVTDAGSNAPSYADMVKSKERAEQTLDERKDALDAAAQLPAFADRANVPRYVLSATDFWRVMRDFFTGSQEANLGDPSADGTAFHPVQRLGAHALLRLRLLISADLDDAPVIQYKRLFEFQPSYGQPTAFLEALVVAITRNALAYRSGVKQCLTSAVASAVPPSADGGDRRRNRQNVAFAGDDAAEETTSAAEHIPAASPPTLNISPDGDVDGRRSVSPQPVQAATPPLNAGDGATLSPGRAAGSRQPSRPSSRARSTTPAARLPAPEENTFSISDVDKICSAWAAGWENFDAGRVEMSPSSVPSPEKKPSRSATPQPSGDALGASATQGTQGNVRSARKLTQAASAHFRQRHAEAEAGTRFGINQLFDSLDAVCAKSADPATAAGAFERCGGAQAPASKLGAIAAEAPASPESQDISLFPFGNQRGILAASGRQKSPSMSQYGFQSMTPHAPLVRRASRRMSAVNAFGLGSLGKRPDSGVASSLWAAAPASPVFTALPTHASHLSLPVGSFSRKVGWPAEDGDGQGSPNLGIATAFSFVASGAFDATPSPSALEPAALAATAPSIPPAPEPLRVAVLLLESLAVLNVPTLPPQILALAASELASIR